MKNLLSLTVMAVVVIWLVGCSEEAQPAHVEREAAQAQAERPVSTEVETISIPANPNLGTWVLVVQPFAMGASGVVSGPGISVINPGEQAGQGVTAQLISALRTVGNVAVVDYAVYQDNPTLVAASVKPNELGPFIVKGTITEFNETADKSGRGESRGPNLALGMVPYIGGVLMLADGGKSSHKTTCVGMVGLDIQIVEHLTGRLVTSFTAEGSFTSVSETKSQTSWGKTKTTTESASSAISQATRVALNKTMVQIHQLIEQQTALAKR